jgi:hypothetical protein
MSYTFTPNDSYSRQSMMDLETQFPIYRIEFQNVQEHTVVDYLSPSVTIVVIDTSSNVIFSVPFPHVKRIHVFGQSITFKDDMFHLIECRIGPSAYYEDIDPRVFLEPGQLRLRNTKTLTVFNAVLHADSLRDAHVERVKLHSCQDPRPIPPSLHEQSALSLYFLFSVFCFLFSIFYFLFSVFCFLFSVFCFLFSVFCFLFSVFYFLFSVFYFLFSIFYFLFSVFCFLFSVFYFLFSIFCFLFSVFYFLFSVF